MDFHVFLSQKSNGDTELQEIMRRRQERIDSGSKDWPSAILQMLSSPHCSLNCSCSLNQSTVEHTEILYTFLIVYLLSPNVYVFRCFLYLIMLLVCLFFYCLMRFSCLNMNPCTVFCECVRACVRTYFYEQCGRRLFSLSILQMFTEWLGE